MSTITEAKIKSKKEKSSKSKKSMSEVATETTSLAEDQSIEVPSTKKDKSTKKEKKHKTKAASQDEDATLKNEDVEAVEGSEKKEKKDKSSKKRKAEGAPEEDTAEAQEPSVDTEPPLESSTTEPPSKKRKSILPDGEIEVDVTAPEPPSKKALRLLKKGKPLPPSKSGADPLGTNPDGVDETEDGKAKEPKKETEKRSEHGIWIGNLPWSVTTEMLQNFFVENSNVELVNITRVHMPSPDDSKPANQVSRDPSWKRQHNKGFAYVDFDTAEATTEAVGLSEELLHGRRVLIKNNKSFEGRPLKGPDDAKNEGKEPSKRIFIGNLRFDATDASVKEHFEQCGPIENIMIATFEDSGKCKGYGWITFETLEAADQAVKGWVPYEEDPDSSDSEISDESESEEDADSDDEAKPKKSVKAPRKPTIRRRYIDKIEGRPTRREFAEAPQVRYKKRYGKDGTKNRAPDQSKPAGDGVERVKKDVEKPKKEYESLGKSYAPRLTGAIRKAEGKKVTF